MTNATYTVKEKDTSATDKVATTIYSAETVFRQVLLREFCDDLVISHDFDEYALDAYDINGSTVIVSGEKVNIISHDEDSLRDTKNNLEERVRYFTLEETD